MWYFWMTSTGLWPTYSYHMLSYFWLELAQLVPFNKRIVDFSLQSHWFFNSLICDIEVSIVWKPLHFYLWRIDRECVVVRGCVCWCCMCNCVGGKRSCSGIAIVAGPRPFPSENHPSQSSSLLWSKVSFAPMTFLPWLKYLGTVLHPLSDSFVHEHVMKDILT